MSETAESLSETPETKKDVSESREQKRQAANRTYSRYRGFQTAKKIGVGLVGIACVIGGVVASTQTAPPSMNGITPAPKGGDQSIKSGDPNEYGTFDSCPPAGKVTGTDTRAVQTIATNKLKNRFTVPSSTTTIDPEAMLKATNSTTVGFSESNGATLTGYVGNVILEKGESCNCGTTGEGEADDHIYVLPTLQDYQAFVQNRKDKSKVIVVEVTPRIKQIAREDGYDWTTSTLQTMIGKQVTFSGWLLRDWEHANVSAADGAKSAERGTVWEIHPVTRIVFPGN